MLTAFIPLVVLVYSSIQLQGFACFLPTTSFLIWLLLTLIALKEYLPFWLESISRDGELYSLLSAQAKFQWVTVCWIAVLFALSAPAMLFGEAICRFFPQAFPAIVAFAIYTGIFKISAKAFYKAFFHYRFLVRSTRDYFRARMAIPALFFPPMLVWLTTEDVFLSSFNEGTAILKTFGLVPIFFFALYTFSPLLFNLAWDAKPLSNDEIEKEVQTLAGNSKVPLAGMRLWDTFGEPLPNAAVAGLVDGYRFLYVTKYLLDIFPLNEIRAIVAHELGHFRLGHVWTYLIFSLNLAFFSLGVGLVVYWHYPNFMADHQTVYFGFEFMIFLGAYFLLFSTLARYCEWQADMFAATLVSPSNLSKALKTISELIAQPSAWLPWWTETHPRFPKRISEIQNWNGSAETLQRNAKIIRIAMTLIGSVIFILSWPLIRESLNLERANEAFRSRRFHEVRGYLTPLQQSFETHQDVLVLSGKLEMAEGKFLNAIFIAAKKTLGISVPLFPSPLEESKHSAPPEIAFQLQLMKFILQMPNLNGIHGVTPFNKSFNFIQTMFRH